MDNVHWLIRTKGIEEARRQAVTKRERQIVEAAYQVLSEEEERIGFSYSGFALTSLRGLPVYYGATRNWSQRCRQHVRARERFRTMASLSPKGRSGWSPELSASSASRTGHTGPTWPPPRRHRDHGQSRQPQDQWRARGHRGGRREPAVSAALFRLISIRSSRHSRSSRRFCARSPRAPSTLSIRCCRSPSAPDRARAYAAAVRRFRLRRLKVVWSGNE